MILSERHSRRRATALGLVALALGGCNLFTPTDNARRDAVLAAHFTQEAAAVLGDIPLRSGGVGGTWSMAIGDDWGSRLASTFYGYGNRRQVLMSEGADDLVVFHEYVHQAHYSGLISDQLFQERYSRLRCDPEFARVAEMLEEFIWENYTEDVFTWLALLYDGGLTRELIAYAIEGWKRGLYDLPDYFLDVYRDTVRMPVAQ